MVFYQVLLIMGHFTNPFNIKTENNDFVMHKYKIKSWQITESEYLHREPWFTVRRDSVRLPNGSCIPNYYVMEFANWVNTIAITKENQYILVSQYRHGLQKINYELCAGVCDETDPTPLYSAQRELLEETGYGNGHWQEFMVLSPNPSNHTNLTYTFLATGVEKIKQPSLEETEDLQVHLVSFEQLKSILEQGKIIQALMAAPLWKFIATHQQKKS